MRGHQRILQLHTLLSKLLDSLCFQITVNKVDQNCFSLLEIIQWKRTGEIDHNEFVQLYKSWLQSKSVFDMFSCKQLETFPKDELIDSELVQSSYMNVGQITKALELINQLYNQLYLEKKPANTQLIQQVQRIFSYLDSTGYIHLRSSNLFFLAGAMTIAENYSIPINYQAFRVHFKQLKRQLCQIDGLVSLRNFKNYFLAMSIHRRTLLLEKVLPILFQFQKRIGVQKPGLPNIIEEAFAKWKFFPRFNNHQSKKNLEVYKRVFQENQKIFFEEGANIDYFLQKYGQQFVRCFDIDASLLRQFNTIIRQILNKNIQMFAKIATKQKQMPSTHKKKQKSQLSQTKLSHRYSGREKTPTKSIKRQDFNKVSKTPTKRMQQVQIRREFGSAEKSKSKTFNARQTTPTKSYRQMPTNLYQSQANTNQKVAIKNGIQKDSFYNKMFFFRNKRVQSYDIVMKRLKGK